MLEIIRNIILHLLSILGGETDNIIPSSLEPSLFQYDIYGYDSNNGIELWNELSQS